MDEAKCEKFLKIWGDLRTRGSISMDASIIWNSRGPNVYFT